jgi:hypothetical protein
MLLIDPSEKIGFLMTFNKKFTVKQVKSIEKSTISIEKPSKSLNSLIIRF